jgi:hypothetical protein
VPVETALPAKAVLHTAQCALLLVVMLVVLFLSCLAGYKQARVHDRH